ncbi:MAG: hypothetical protein EP307_02700 [Rhodobacteraceae bacterium]|nr:MAG: hypothetical protein EP307_02700 [Paracoccaceae bacterium]
MALQNRVQPTGEIVAHPARGLFMGNRGILHDDAQRLGAARWRHKAWVTCVLSFKGRRRALMAPGRYTELFFHDEAVALAAGHRPCAECRRAEYLAYRSATGIPGRAVDLDRQLHRARAVPRLHRQRRHAGDIRDLPDGVFILRDEGPCLVHGDSLRPFAPAGYGPPLPRPRGGAVAVLTPEPSVEALRNGYIPVLRLGA